MDSDFTPETGQEDPPEQKVAKDKTDSGASAAAPSNKKHQRLIARLKALSKQQQLALGGGILLVIIGLSVGVVLALHHPKKVVPAVIVKPKPAPAKPAPAPLTSRLTGLPVTQALYNRPVTAIMIENSPDARPQSGLKDAGVVFEAIAEGGITRFLTLHEEDEPDYIGPVRSVRPYYVDWLEGFDAPVAHAGGSAQGLAEVAADGVPNLDGLVYSNYFMRISSRYAPHNLYTTTAKLDALEASKGITSSTFTGFPRKAEKPLTTPTAKTIDFAISGYLYNVHYDYDGATNTYKRSEGGTPHIDQETGAQLSPKVVIAIVMKFNIDPNGVNSDYNSIGSGVTYVFQDGGVTTGTWQKTSKKSQITFTDSSGQPIKLDPGQTWISAVNGTSDVSYKP
jgi:hypothetical protein